MASRKDELKETASLAGNAAAHLAVYLDDSYTIREVLLYHEQAAKIAKMRTWNETEVAYFRERTIRNAGNEIKQRKDDWSGRTFKQLLADAIHFIDKFIAEDLRQKSKSGQINRPSS